MSRRQNARSHGLGARVLTALLLAGLLVPAVLYLPQLAWAYLMALLAALAAWEWGALSRLQATGRMIFGLVVFGVCAALILAKPDWITGLNNGDYQAGGEILVYGAAAVFWVLLAPIILKYGWRLARPLTGLPTGLLVIIPTWLAMVQLRTLGSTLFLAILTCVFMADIAAYIVGSVMGRHKLAPQISPNKSLEGALASVLTVVFCGLVLLRHFHFDLLPTSLMTLMFAAFAVLGILGDMLESFFKRQAKLKDSGSLLPGHGGLLDRVDSLCATLPVFALLWFYLRY